jgi:cytochrome c oxidase accessory protein FixG
VAVEQTLVDRPADTADEPALVALVRSAVAEAAGPDPAPAPAAAPVPLYAPRRKIYPQSVHGTFRRIKWAILVVTLGIYYLTPFVRWDRGPHAPDQAVLIDFSTRRFYFFFIEIWPQEVYYLTGLLIIAAMVLFLMNALAGRVWCGYLCPQTVWTDLFQMIERWTEGDRREHQRRDTQGWTAGRIARATAKHSLWLMIAWWTGGAWVLYFADAPTLVKELATLQAPFIAYAWIGILTFTTYSLAGHMREQVCQYMCPWPRIQASLTDEHALNVTYRYDRGEPRGSVKKAVALRQQGQPAGDCIDCLQCVNVCPGGVDIRDGASLGCFQCGLCIDACDSVMSKIGRPKGLIAYDTDVNVKRRQSGLPPIFKIMRVRTALYVGIIALVAGLMLYTLVTRQAEGLAVIHDRNPIYVRLSDGATRNGYTVRLLNKSLEQRRFLLTTEGVADGLIEVVGDTTSPMGYPRVEIGPDQTREIRVLVTSYDHLPPAASIPITFRAIDMETRRQATATDFFKGP